MRQEFQCPANDDCVFSGCLYLNPEDCNTFWQCDRKGRSWLRRCGYYLLEFNDYIKTCTWPSDKTCKLAPIPTAIPPSSLPSTTAKLSTPQPNATSNRTESALSSTETAPIQTTTVETIQTTTDSLTTAEGPTDGGFLCPEEDIAATGCLGPEDCLYQNPDDCGTFIQCKVNADNKTGTPHFKPCAPAHPPFQWNDDKKLCDYPPSPTCSNCYKFALV